VLHQGEPAARGDGDARDERLSDDLRQALHEWAAVADAVVASGDDRDVDLLRRRGRQLASRVADTLGRPVRFVDPVSGAVESIRGGAGGRVGGGAAVPAARVPAADDARPPVAAGPDAAGPDGPVPDGPVPDGPVPDGPVPDGPDIDAAQPAGPTPWGTGTVVAAFFAVLIALADIALARAFAGAVGLLWVPANLLVTAGTIPSLWLARNVPFWRWPAYGAAAGIGMAWVVTLLGLLAP
jgi:hypothetical protein